MVWRLLLFFMGAIATYYIFWLFVWAFPEAVYDITQISKILFLSGLLGGFLTGDPIIGACAGFVAYLPLIDPEYDILSPIPFLIISIGGFLGGWLSKILFRIVFMTRRKNAITHNAVGGV
jgi:hypothetical protein